jgi:hypothetical protein
MLTEKSIVTGAQGAALLTHDDYRGMARQGDSLWQLKSFVDMRHPDTINAP